MQVTNAFISIGARDHPASCGWWSQVLGRQPDRHPAPDCCEWVLTDTILFQVLENPNPAVVQIVSLRLPNLEAEIERLRGLGIAIEGPEPVPGFATLRMAQFHDPDGNLVNLLGGE